MVQIIKNEQTKGYEVVYGKKEIAQEKDSQVIPRYDKMMIGTLYGGLPIYDTSTNLSPKVGEIYLVECGSRRICARFENITVSTTLT